MKVGITVICKHCDGMYCQYYRPGVGGCIGWPDEPKVGDLWPGESENDFGYRVSADGTKEVSAD